MEDQQHQNLKLTLDEKKNKIQLNYETIQVLKARLDESKKRKILGMTRAAYIRMIFDVTKKVDRQNEELSKALLDTRRLQRDIANLGDRLDRNFKLVENTIVKSIKNDAWSRECYRLLNVMHENCDQLIQAVQQTGDLTREMRQLEDQISQTRAARDVDTL